ncbi:NAI2-like protein isoform X2 [Raphanus sativus]|uniref:NAI2-like protein isoform X2 n=1 Tax=Raphanus sativus TaxID=3726 RepID=A0A9W3CWP9_RAPSA|nr:NAI2-like protein isoform X2 [Raphanus sativus]
MTISAMGNKRVVLALAICLVLSSFHEVSCQVGGTNKFGTLEGQESEYNVQTGKATSSVSHSVEAESEAASSYEAGQSSSSSDDIKRLMQGFNKNDGTEADLMDASETGASNQERVKELQRQMEASSRTVVEEEEITEEKSKLETLGTTFQGSESRDDGSDINQIYYKNNGEKESEGNRGFMIKEPIITRNEDESMGSRQQYESKQESMEGRLEYESKTSSSGSGVIGSLSIGQSGAWRCINPDKDGVKGDDSMVIPKYDLNDIIKEESIKGSSSKTSSLITSLTEIVDNHKKGRWTDVKIGKVSTTETSEKVRKLKMTLQKYVGIKVHELVARSDYEDILTMGARYEELTRAKVPCISRLATYGTVIREGFKASQRVKTVHQTVILHEKMAIEKQKRVDAEFESVKALAQKGDNLAVQIFAMKKAVLKLEAEKKQVEIKFQRSVENLSIVLEESSHAYEKHRVVVREWKEVQASAEYSLETIQKADVVWVQFLNTLT